MSSALVRQALELVDGEESGKKKRRGKAAQRRPTIVQDIHLYKRKSKKTPKKTSKSDKDLAEENIRKLLALSEPAANSRVAEKIIQRAVKRQPLAEKIEIKTEKGKSILFPEESFKNFEKEYFCS